MTDVVLAVLGVVVAVAGHWWQERELYRLEREWWPIHVWLMAPQRPMAPEPRMCWRCVAGAAVAWCALAALLLSG